MPKLKSLNIARNGQMTGLSICGLLNRLTEKWHERQAIEESANITPCALEKLIVQGNWLGDDGVTDLLPLIAGPALGSIRVVNLTACRLSQAS